MARAENAHDSARVPGGGIMIWVLLGRRAGDNKQMLALARATGLPFETRQLAFNGLSALPNLLLGPSRRSLSPSARPLLAPPWPDIVIASGRRSVPAARWIRAQSRGRVRLVHVGRPWAPLHWFDLVVTTPQYGLPDRPPVLSNLLPLTDANPPAPDFPAWLAALPEPRLGALVGGNSRPLVLDAAVADALADHLLAQARAMGGSLTVATSPRTPPAVAARLAQRLDRAADVASHLHRWSPDAANAAYQQLLHHADRLAVTGDSAAMIADAVMAGRPIEIFPLPARPDLRWRISRGFQAGLRRLPGGQRMLRGLIDIGMIVSVRDLDRYARALQSAGLLSGGGGPAIHGRAELVRSAAAVRRLAPGQDGPHSQEDSAA